MYTGGIPSSPASDDNDDDDDDDDDEDNDGDDDDDDDGDTTDTRWDETRMDEIFLSVSEKVKDYETLSLLSLLALI